MNDKLSQVLSKQKEQISGPETKNSDDIVQLVGFVVGEEEYARDNKTHRIYTRS